MGEFNKDPNQSGIGKDQRGGKPAFGQFEKGQQDQQDVGEKTPDYGDEKGQGQQFSKDPAGQQQFTKDQSQYGQEKQADVAKGDQQQQKIENEGQRQQGDEDLGDDSIDNQNLK